MKGRDLPKRQKKRAARSFAELADQLKPERPTPALKPAGPDPADDPALLYSIHGPDLGGDR
jgi:hypothetical protein